MDGQTKQDLTQIHASLDAEVAEASPRCEMSGKCCRFGEYGHTLFLSDLEAELLLETPPDQPVRDGFCPYQVNGLCQARERRPLGCRVYFCDPNYQERQFELSERYIARLKQLYLKLQRPWSYRPLHSYLRERFGCEPGASNGKDLPNQGKYA